MPIAPNSRLSRTSLKLTSASTVTGPMPVLPSREAPKKYGATSCFQSSACNGALASSAIPMTEHRKLTLMFEFSQPSCPIPASMSLHLLARRRHRHVDRSAAAVRLHVVGLTALVVSDPVLVHDVRIAGQGRRGRLGCGRRRRNVDDRGGRCRRCCGGGRRGCRLALLG